MAKKPLRGNYLTLEDVRITYDKKTDSIHLTSKDKDLPDGGFHLTLNKGREAEQALRSLLINAGMAQDKEEDTIPKILPFSVQEQANGITLGQGANGKWIRWIPENSAHMFISGGTGRGKSVFLRNLIYSGIVHNGLHELGATTEPVLEFYVADAKMLGFPQMDGYQGDLATHTKDHSAIKTLAFTYGDIEAMIHECFDEMNHRYDVMEEQRIPTNSMLPEPFPRRIIIIDEAAHLFGDHGIDMDEAERGRHEELLHLIYHMSRVSRAAGIHLVMASQDPGFLFGEFKANFGTKIAVGKHTKQGSFSLIRGSEASLISGEVRGRCYIDNENNQEEFQMFLSSEKDGQNIKSLFTLVKDIEDKYRKSQEKGK
jgi:hypothetical protein